MSDAAWQNMGQILTASSLVITAASGLITLWKVNKVEHHTNSMMEEMVKSAKKEEREKVSDEMVNATAAAETVQKIRDSVTPAPVAPVAVAVAAPVAAPAAAVAAAPAAAAAAPTEPDARQDARQFKVTEQVPGPPTSPEPAPAPPPKPKPKP